MDVNIYMSLGTFAAGAGVYHTVMYFIRRALHVPRELPENGSKTDPNQWLIELRSRVDTLERERRDMSRELAAVIDRFAPLEAATERVPRIEEDVSLLEADVVSLRRERKLHRQS